MALFDHLGVVVTNLSTAHKFYTACLSEIGVQLLQNNSISDSEGWLVYGTDEVSDFFIVSAGRPSFWNPASSPGTAPIHIAFVAPSESAVQNFYQAGLEHGGRDNGPPGTRPSTTQYYAAYLIDPDGNNVEAGFRSAH